MVPMNSRPELIEASRNSTHILWNVSKFLDQTAKKTKAKKANYSHFIGIQKPLIHLHHFHQFPNDCSNSIQPLAMDSKSFWPLVQLMA